MVEPYEFIHYFGFTFSEAKVLCERFGMDMNEIKAWYTGYFIEAGNPIYNPRSVSRCLRTKALGNYWNKTETYEALKVYITWILMAC